MGGEDERYARPWSIVEEASRRQVSAAKNDVRDAWRDSDHLTIRGEESWMAVHHRLHLLRYSLAFHRIIGNDIKFVDGDITRIRGRRRNCDNVGHSIAVCQRVMMAGGGRGGGAGTAATHTVEFEVTDVGGNIGFGIVRPMHDYPHGRMRYDEFGSYCDARRRLNVQGYEGDVHRICERVPNLDRGDVVRMTLDLNGGTLSVYKNGSCAFVIARVGGLSGHYCWAVTMDKLGYSRPSVRILPESNVFHIYEGTYFKC
jgi:hypothetical protein